MKRFIIVLFFLSFCLLGNAQQVSYKLAYNMATQTYTVSMKSNTAYNPPLSRFASSIQFTVVTPHVAGGWQPANVNTAIVTTPISPTWTYTILDGTTLTPPIPANDYLLFTLGNAANYTPFIIPANTYIDLFTFQSGSGCVGALSLYDNITDPLNLIPTIGGDNNMVILGAGPGNIYTGNDSGSIPCTIVVPACTAAAGVLSY